MELQFEAKIKCLQTDWGGEYQFFSSFFSILGLSRHLICSHTHHQNDVVEHKHRHIIKLDLTFLSHASLPLKF